MVEGFYAKEIHHALTTLYPDFPWKGCASHCGKKTAYLLAILGGAQEFTVSEAGRNRTQSNARSYVRDVMSLKAKYESEGTVLLWVDFASSLC